MLHDLEQRPLPGPCEGPESDRDDHLPAPAISAIAVPRPHHTSCDDVTTVPRSHDSDAHMSSLVAEIEERLAVLEDGLAKLAPIVHERQLLLTARAQLLGEPPPALPTPSRRRITRDDVASVLRLHPGLRAGEIARALDAGQPAVSAHLYRGKQTRFRSRGGRWFLADQE
jgi:DNA-binding transcriptional ArsR family regulator